ncbi:MAG: DNA-3-methyladenine glycosylase I [Kiritimatiellae bacterium]|nr:DNA-3-methyladenine glycosylase I [Kiritimatiellia bacterium]
MIKKIRCPYFELNDLERAYHDKEWGTPCRNDRKLFEYLMYEVLQCGLSWDTIIQKRAAFRVAFERFDFEKIARYGERDIARILAVPGMIRSRRKIEAIIHDAQRFIALRRECGTFSKWLWAFTDGKTLHNPDNAKSDDWTAPARTELSDRIAAELKARGFKFLGSVTIYAFMQSVGLVNDHARFCFRYKELRKGHGVAK